MVRTGDCWFREVQACLWNFLSACAIIYHNGKEYGVDSQAAGAKFFARPLYRLMEEEHEKKIDDSCGAGNVCSHGRERLRSSGRR